MARSRALRVDVCSTMLARRRAGSGSPTGRSTTIMLAAWPADAPATERMVLTNSPGWHSERAVSMSRSPWVTAARSWSLTVAPRRCPRRLSASRSAEATAIRRVGPTVRGREVRGRGVEKADIASRYSASACRGPLRDRVGRRQGQPSAPPRRPPCASVRHDGIRSRRRSRRVGALAGVRTGGSSRTTSGSASSRTVSRRIPAMPSASTWCTTTRIAKRPSGRPSTTSARHRGWSRPRGRMVRLAAHVGRGVSGATRMAPTRPLTTSSATSTHTGAPSPGPVHRTLRRSSGTPRARTDSSRTTRPVSSEPHGR